jgi:hypothetical protein
MWISSNLWKRQLRVNCLSFDGRAVFLLLFFLHGCCDRFEGSIFSRFLFFRSQLHMNPFDLSPRLISDYAADGVASVPSPPHRETAFFGKLGDAPHRISSANRF